jgi:hypothetical protein
VISQFSTMVRGSLTLSDVCGCFFFDAEPIASWRVVT